MDASRIVVYSPQDSFLFEIGPRDTLSFHEYEEVNGQRVLRLTTPILLSKEQRVLTFDGTDKAREYVVTKESVTHIGGTMLVGSYECVWSLQHDLSLSVVSSMPGVQTPTTAALALDAALGGTDRWVRGVVTVETVGGASMYQMSGWQAMSVLIGTWGGEVDADITVDLQGVISRKVNLLEHLGEATAKRRFDYSRDLTGVTRDVLQDAVACRIIPRGKGEPSGDGYSRKITIESVNDGIAWLEDSEAALAYRLPKGDGTYEYPTVYADNGSIDDPSALKAWGQAVIHDYTRPMVSYSTTVDSIDGTGEGIYGVALGDAVQCVDREFGPSGLRLSGRVTAIDHDRKNPRLSVITLGNATAGGTFQSNMARAMSDIGKVRLDQQSVREYIDDILGNINAAINATGGYTYLTEGQGMRTYDTAVSNPLVGAEASKVVEVKGGSIRIADSRTSQGEWNWRTVFVSGHVAADLVTAAELVAGHIGNQTSGNFWDLDNGELRLMSTAMLGDRTVAQALSGIDATITDVDVQYAQGTSASTTPSSGWSTTAPAWESGKYIWQRTATTTGTGTAAVTSYSTPVMISGRDGVDGQDGSDGTGITTIVEQYYLSTSDSTQTGGSWSATQPAWESGKYIWTRSEITWDTTPATTTTTTPVLATALTQANSSVADVSADLDETKADLTSVSADVDAMRNDYTSVMNSQTDIAAQLGLVHDDLVDEINDARRYATDYLTYANGELILGVSGDAVKNVITATQQTYRTSAGDVAGYGLFDGVWEMFIETARVKNLLRFGKFAWIARSNGNMTLKWTG